MKNAFFKGKKICKNDRFLAAKNYTSFQHRKKPAMTVLFRRMSRGNSDKESRHRVGKSSKLR